MCIYYDFARSKILLRPRQLFYIADVAVTHRVDVLSSNEILNVAVLSDSFVNDH